MIRYDFVRREGYVSLKGAETIQLISSFNEYDNKLSRIKYVKANALLKETKENKAFREFTAFVDNMLLFYALQESGYQGFRLGADNISQGIIREGKVKEFESFLRSQGVDYHFVVVNVNGLDELYCKFEHGLVPFALIASTGTKSLSLFYYWYIKLTGASFVFIDGYDAFYHFALSQCLLSMIKRLDNTQVLLSTHNTDLILYDFLRPDAYFIIDNGRIQSIDKLAKKELRYAHDLQKMYKAGMFHE